MVIELCKSIGDKVITIQTLEEPPHMAELQSNLVRDGKGGQIKFPIFISQADMDLIEKEFIVMDRIEQKQVHRDLQI